MKNTCVSMPGDLLVWLTAEAKRRDSSVSQSLSDLAQREKDSSTMDEIVALKKRLEKVETYTGELRGRYG